MADKLIIIGDSFASPSNDASFYGKFLEEDFPHLEVKWYGIGSRDVQSIIDDWIKVLPRLDDEDYLIVALPVFSRTRLPLSEKEYGGMDLLGNYKNRFIGTSSYVKGVDLEFFGSTFDTYYFESMLNPQKIISSTKAAELNFFEVIGSLKKLTKSKHYIFSWSKFENKSKPFDDRDDLFAKLGIWKTIGDVYLERGQPKEWEGDFHWEYSTHLAFSEMIKKEFGMKRKII
jgi:hypothetical protein